jgi:tetratricopeptide (TPR) repeat protein
VNSIIVKALTDRAESLVADGRLRDALPLATRAVDLAPLNEHAWRRLIRLHYLRNDLASARDTGLQLAAVLRAELGARPSEESLQLMQTVEAAQQPGPLTRRPVPASLVRPPVLIGRQPIWQAMGAAWQRPQPFLLVGDAGQGKSRLLEEFVQQHQGVLQEKAQPGDEPSPYAVLGRIAISIHHRFDLHLPDAVRGELARIRPEFGAPPASPANGPLLWHALEQVFVQALSHGLTGLIIDDLHNADSATLEALCWLNARPALGPLRIGLATRPLTAGPGADAIAAWLGASQHPVQLQVDALAADDLAALLSSLALPALFGAQVADKLYRHAGGHLLFTLATLQEVITQGAGFGADALPRPSSIQALLDERLRRLPADAQSLVRIAAAAGADFTAERAARLLGQPLLELVDSWSVLEAADVLRGDAFSHDLVHESALRSVPAGLRSALHRQLAELLVGDLAAPPSRVAWHWEQGGRWAEAARSWHAAGDLARVAGRLDEQIEFYERAAALYHRASDQPARFESLMARLEGLRMRSGGGAALACLPEVEALASTGVERLRCHIARALAWLDGGHGEPAAEAATAALREAEFHAQWRAEAGVVHAQALSQCGLFDAALIAAHAALAAADLAPPRVRLAALNALSYAHYATGRLAEAVRWQREAIAEAERQSDHTTAILGEGNLAALLASVGDVPGTYAQALRTHPRYTDIQVGDNSSFGIVNHLVLGAAAAALGRFDQALPALQAAVAAAGEDAASLGRTKSRLALAQLWLTLGRAGESLSLLDTLPQQAIPGMAIQAALLRARAAEQLGLPAGRHLDQLARLAAEHRQLPLVQSAWFEVSHVGDAQEMLDALAGIRAQCEALGLTGTARSLQWRELVRCLDIGSPAATDRALAMAYALAPHANAGMSAKCYPPEVWWTLAQAFERAGDATRRADALASARRWIEAARPRVPEPYRQDFEQRNGVNRRLLRPVPSGGGCSSEDQQPQPVDECSERAKAGRDDAVR